MRLKRTLILFSLIFAIHISNAQSRKIINIPNIPGYQALKCDFHMHTVFSDGTVWPTVRVEEAWQEGLDAIAITDHIEYRPHTKDIEAGHNRSFEIAQPLANQSNLILVHAAEITRSMPPGHLNALFVTNANLLERDNVMDALKEAKEQGAFIFWNHPGWKAQQPDTTLWWKEHTQLFKSGLMHGIEVLNSTEYYPEALEWANEKKLTMLCNTDVHGPIGMSYDVKNGHRPLTLVFAKTRNIAGIKEALFNQRTVAYFDNTLIGKPELLEPLFFSSLKFADSPLRLGNGVTKQIWITNNSDVDYEMELVQPGIGFDAPESITLEAQHVTPLVLSGNSDQVGQTNKLELYYRIKNMQTSVDDNLVITFSFRNN